MHTYIHTYILRTHVLKRLNRAEPSITEYPLKATADTQHIPVSDDTATSHAKRNNKLVNGKLGHWWE